MGKITELEKKDPRTYESDPEVEEEDDDQYDPSSETLIQRIYLLTEIFPEYKRQRVQQQFKSGFEMVKKGMRVLGHIGWIVSTSTILLVFPILLESQREEKLLQWEQEMNQKAQMAQRALMPPSQQQQQPVFGQPQPLFAPQK